MKILGLKQMAALAALATLALLVLDAGAVLAAGEEVFTKGGALADKVGSGLSGIVGKISIGALMVAAVLWMTAAKQLAKSVALGALIGLGIALLAGPGVSFVEGVLK